LFPHALACRVSAPNLIRPPVDAETARGAIYVDAAPGCDITALRGRRIVRAIVHRVCGHYDVRHDANFEPNAGPGGARPAEPAWLPFSCWRWLRLCDVTESDPANLSSKRAVAQCSACTAPWISASTRPRGDGGEYRIPGFPYLRTDRFGASFRIEALRAKICSGRRGDCFA